MESIETAIKLLIDHSHGDFVSQRSALDTAINLQSFLAIINKSGIASILIEVDRAEKKHPNWPNDMVYAAAIIAEESGELIRSAVQHEMESEFGCIEDVKKETIQTAATCIRLLKNL